MKRKLFCEISPITYKISMEKEILLRKMRDTFMDDPSIQAINTRISNESTIVDTILAIPKV